MGWCRYGSRILMIGAAKTQSAGVNIVSQYAVTLNPGVVSVFSSNGSASSPIIRSTVNGGVGPFTYQWVITGSDITINTPTSEDTIFRASGFNTEYIELATLTVTDTGNGNDETDVDINVNFEFENQGL